MDGVNEIPYPFIDLYNIHLAEPRRFMRYNENGVGVVRHDIS